MSWWVKEYTSSADAVSTHITVAKNYRVVERLAREWQVGVRACDEDKKI